ATHGGHGVAHGGKIDHAGDAGEVLEYDAGRQEGDLAATGRGRRPSGERGNMLRGDKPMALVAQGVFQQNPDRVGQAVEVSLAGFFEGLERINGYFSAALLESLAAR